MLQSSLKLEKLFPEWNIGQLCDNFQSCDKDIEGQKKVFIRSLIDCASSLRAAYVMFASSEDSELSEEDHENILYNMNLLKQKFLQPVLSDSETSGIFFPIIHDFWMYCIRAGFNDFAHKLANVTDNFDPWFATKLSQNELDERMLLIISVAFKTDHHVKWFKNPLMSLMYGILEVKWFSGSKIQSTRKNHYRPVFDYLLEQLSDKDFIDFKNPYGGYTSLHLAYLSDDQYLISKLIKYGADQKICDCENRKPSDLAPLKPEEKKEIFRKYCEQSYDVRSQMAEAECSQKSDFKSHSK